MITDLGKSCSQRRHKLERKHHSHPPEQLGAADITINSCPVRTIFTYPKQITHLSPLLRALGPGLEHNGPHWSPHLWDASPGAWPCWVTDFGLTDTSLAPKNKQESLHRKPWAPWLVCPMRMITAPSPLRLQLVILDQTGCVLPTLNPPQVQQGMW